MGEEARQCEPPVGEARSDEAAGKRYERDVAVMNPGLSGALREYSGWLDGVEPAWTVLEPAGDEALASEPSAEGGVLRLGVDLSDEEFARSAMVRNALVLLRAAAEGDGLELTARANLTRAEVSAMREAMRWPGCGFEEKRRAGKLLSGSHARSCASFGGWLKRPGSPSASAVGCGRRDGAARR